MLSKSLTIYVLKYNFLRLLEGQHLIDIYNLFMDSIFLQRTIVYNVRLQSADSKIHVNRLVYLENTVCENSL